jgi:hypothetical protein
MLRCRRPRGSRCRRRCSGQRIQVFNRSGTNSYFDELFRVEKMRWLVGLGILLGLIGLYFGFLYYRNFEQYYIRSQLDEIASTAKPTADISQYQLVCFTQNVSRAREEFITAAKGAGHDISNSMEACGTNNSCCDPLHSNASGVIGFVSDSDITCVSITRFMFVLEKERSLCLEPSQIRVSREVFTSEYRPGNAWIGKIGEQYYEIDKR